MVNVDVVWNWNSLGEVNHPDGSSTLVMDEEERAADQLMRSEEMGFYQRCANVL